VIRYSLVCARAHEFDAWFRDIATFDDQAANCALTCPFCQSTDIQKGVMAPHVARAVPETHAAPPPQSRAADGDGGGDAVATSLTEKDHSDLREKLRDLREKILATTEDVGERFPAEARKMQDGDRAPRAIRGRATLEEAKALIDEGVAVLPVPGEGH